MTDPINNLDAIAALPFSALSGPEAGEQIRDSLIAEIRSLRAEITQLDRICAHQRHQYQPPMDEEFGCWVGGSLCEHPSVTGDRCDACGWKREAHRD